MRAATRKDGPVPDGPETTRALPTRRRVLIVTACSVAALAAGGGLTAAFAFGDDSAPEKKRVDIATALVEKGTLQGASRAAGTLSFGGSRTIASGAGGVITALPAPGLTVKLGESLFAVDNQPTYAMLGGLPAWRSFETGMGDGPDVTALEESLAALGHFDGTPDATFDWETRAAVRRWQKATGQEQTGTIPLGRIEFSSGEVRVSELKAAVGDRTGPGSPIVEVTDTTQVVNVDLRLADQQLASVGVEVTIDLPDGARTGGKVASVGVPTEKEGSNGRPDIVIPVSITLDDPAATGALQQASVTVGFPSQRRENVLSVPVGALLALDGDRFGIEVVGDGDATTRVPVTTGLFAAGRVEISGSGVREGQKVVVPAR
ncbi:peptidoglycan-binding protein [Leifsonia sp. McL0607]|uniref:peptidoglycan-binding protein n=1 Tax=Leifsonia sp. McL0607 TaxID=3415672 RepID=UPI003CF56FB3